MLRQPRRCMVFSLNHHRTKYTAEALAILTNKKKNLRILALPFDAQEASEVEAEYTGVVGGLLVQNQDVVKESPADWQVVTKRQPTETEATSS